MKRKNISVCIIQNPQGEFLLQKKTLDHPYTHVRGKWTFFGGKVEEGEEPKETLEREFKEETNLEINKIKLYQTIEYTNPANEFIVLHVFEGVFDKKVSEISLTEGAGFAFFDSKELENLNLYEPYKKILKKHLENNILNHNNL